MGEEADYIYDQIMDSEWGFYRATQTSRPVCMFCGLWLRWHEFPKGWRLANPDNTIHNCRTASLDEFDTV